MVVRDVLLAAAGAFIAACSTPPAASPSSGRDAGSESRAAALDDTVHVVLGRTATADRGRLALTFVRQVSDSRCPANAVCVWMGDAAVRVTARADAATVERELHTSVEPHSLSIGPYTVTIVGLLPYPGPNAPGPVTVILRVVRA